MLCYHMYKRPEKEVMNWRDQWECMGVDGGSKGEGRNGINMISKNKTVIIVSPHTDTDGIKTKKLPTFACV